MRLSRSTRSPGIRHVRGRPVGARELVLPPAGLANPTTARKENAFARPKGISLPLARYVSGLGPTNGSIAFRVLSPSSRLRLMLALAFEGNVGITRPTGANTWTLTPFVKTGITPSDTGTAAGGGLPDIFTGRQLPDAWEFDTAADDLRGTADFNAVGGYSLSGSGPWYWMLTARWEPNTSIEPAELERLYSLCSLQAPQPIVVST